MRRLFGMIRRLAMASAFLRKTLYGIAIGCALTGSSCVSRAQVQAACGVDGYRVVGKRWDAVLKIGLEYRQECMHPGWPPRLVAMISAADDRIVDNKIASVDESKLGPEPLLVNAGAQVRLWSQGDMVRIEMNGVVERSARKGEHVTVQVTHQSDETGLTVERIDGVVRGPGDVEMDR